MNIWRLIPYHVRDRAPELAAWSRQKGVLAIGWGQMKDLRQYSIQNEAQMKRLVADTHLRPGYTTNSQVNGGCSLWRFYHEMQEGDLVIISTSGSRQQTMRVIGEYYYVPSGEDTSHHYEHRRKAEVVPINPDRLWHFADGAAPGEGIYSTLVRCARGITEAEVKALAG